MVSFSGFTHYIRNVGNKGISTRLVEGFLSMYGGRGSLCGIDSVGFVQNRQSPEDSREEKKEKVGNCSM